MKDVYILDCSRTAVGSFGGTLSNVHPADFAKDVIVDLYKRNDIMPEEIDEVILGNVLGAGLGQNVARQAAIYSGIPVEKTAMSVNMVCGSGLRALMLGTQSIKCGDADTIIAGGTENMSMAPYLLPKARYGYRMGNGEIVDGMVYDGLWEKYNNYHMGITAENLAEKYGISREEQDEFACASQNKAEEARKSGRFQEEITSVGIPQRKGDPVAFKDDEYIREGATVEGLAKLRPAFKKDGTVTAGNASGINDSAAAAILVSEDVLKQKNVEPLARIVSYGYAGCPPEIMGIGPVGAVKVALKKAGWSIGNLELIEANEAFAAQSIAVNRELGWDTSLINVNGGAIAIGHPIGASGARILVTLIYEMKRRNLHKGIATLCIGGGMGAALCVEM